VGSSLYREGALSGVCLCSQPR